MEFNFNWPVQSFSNFDGKLNSGRGVSEQIYYTIVAPKNLRPNSDYTLNLTIHDAKREFDEAIVVRVSIEDQNDKASFNIHQDVTMEPNATVIVKMPVGDLSLNHNYKLIAKGISGIALEHNASLDLQKQTHIILIQTDKAIYKPNDCIKYRVLVLDSELKGAAINNKELSICLADPCRNLMKQMDVSTTNGVYSDEYRLSDVPNFGEWKITAGIGDQVKLAVIEVAEYVLPKFGVTIDAHDHFTIEDENIKAIVRAKYTHGKPLRGTAVVSIAEDVKYNSRCFNQGSELVKRTVTIDGCESIEFNIQNELKFDRSDANKYCNELEFIIKAEVTDMITGQSQSTEKIVTIHKDTYKITTDLNNAGLKRDSKTNITISVRRHDSLPINFIDPQKKNITVIRQRRFTTVNPCHELTTRIEETTHELDKNGDAFLKIDIDKIENDFSLKAKYGNQETQLGMFWISNAVTEKIDLKATVLTDRCLINKAVEVEVTSHNNLPSYTYVIVARGRILEAKTLTPIFAYSESSKYMHRFSFVPNFDYAPKAKIVVYFVRDQSIVSTAVDVTMNEDFKNFIELDVAPDTAKPGQIVDINVKSNPNSYIGLLGVDKSVIILRGGNDLTHDEIWKQLESFHSNVKRTMKWGGPFSNTNSHNQWKEFTSAGLITFSNTIEPPQFRSCYPNFMVSGGSPQVFGGPPQGFRGFGCAALPLKHKPEPVIVEPIVRKEFPETWIWESIEDASFNGSLNLKKKVPDALTTWILTGFSIDPVNGLAITKKPSELCVQQQFHISLSLPYSVKRGEIVTIPCSIFNYLPNDIETEVVLENEHNEFEFVDAAVNDQIYPEITKQQFRKKKLTVRSDDALNVQFTIRPTKVGLISLKVSALSTVASDCVIKTLNVECEGVPQFVNKAFYVDLRERSQIDPFDLAIEIPKIALPDSTRIEITCVGDLLGGTIKNLHQLIRLPYGCGEQNMLNFVPNIVVLNYLKNTHQLTAEIEARAKKFMEIGYQRELSYKHKDGSFSAFGESDKSGSTWLTAFVARSFRQASEHIVIQDHTIDEALKWLSEAQAPDGSFNEKGSICHKEMQSGSSNGVALTAYVLTAFLVNKSSNNAYEETIQKAINNIVESIKDCQDVYALAVSAFALQLAGHDTKKMVLDRLKDLAKTNDNHMWWDKSVELKQCCFRESKTLNVEITAYALLTLQLNGQESECLPILKWLLNQRNSQGGFEGTQDTIVGIEALATIAAKIATKDNDVKIDISTPNDTKYSFEVNKDNSLVLQSQKLAPDVKSVSINASGKGFALLELGYRYNVDAPESKPAFSLKPVVSLIDDEHMSLKINTSYQPPKGKDLIKQSNMVVLETALPSGFVVNPELLNGLKSTLPLIKRIETRNSDTVAVLYFDHLTSDPVTLKIDGFREHLVDEQKPSSVLIYDYYDNALSAREFYTLPAIEPKSKIDA